LTKRSTAEFIIQIFLNQIQCNIMV